MSKFDAFETAVETIRSLRPALRKVWDADPDLGKQMRRAMSSVALNINEGRGLQGGNAVKAFTYAAGSNKEVEGCLRIALAFGYLSTKDVEQSLELLDRNNAMLWRLSHPRGQ